MANRMKGNKGMKEIKERTNQGEWLTYERNCSLLNFNGLLKLVG
jgi:hypothetical protein